MNREDLALFLEENFSKTGTLFLTQLVYNNELSVRDVLYLCKHENQKILFRASWLLEHIEYHHPNLFKIVLKEFLLDYPNQVNESAQRCFSKILMSLSCPKGMKFYNLDYKDFEDSLSASFDWLINENTPVAIKSNCIDIIYQLYKNEDWIENELKIILEQNLLSTSPALLSRTKKVLKKLK